MLDTSLRPKRKAKSYTPINKSLLAFGEGERTRSRPYLDQAPKMRCASCGRDAHVAAHIRTGLNGGTGLKPSDKLTDWLCTPCHNQQEANPGPLWWYENVRKVPTVLGPRDWMELEYIPARKRAYAEWEKYQK